MAYSEKQAYSDVTSENELLAEQDLPDPVQEAAWNQDTLPSEYEPFSNGALTLYRGDTASIYHDMETGTHLTREEPIYFVDSYSRAQRYAEQKVNGEDKILLQVEVPEKYLSGVASLPVNDIEKAHEEEINIGMQPETVYFNDVSLGDAEWAASKIPKDWVDIVYKESPEIHGIAAD